MLLLRVLQLQDFPKLQHLGAPPHPRPTPYHHQSSIKSADIAAHYNHLTNPEETTAFTLQQPGISQYNTRAVVRFQAQ